MRRLFDMKLAEGSEALDVVQLVEQQPALLLQVGGLQAAGLTGWGGAHLCASNLRRAASHASSCCRGARMPPPAPEVVPMPAPAPLPCLQEDAGLSDDETAAERLQAWQHGLVSDGTSEWARRYQDLLRYRDSWGDAHVGFRDGDDEELSRWAAKQRSQHRAGQLAADKQEQLQVGGAAGGHV